MPTDDLQPDPIRRIVEETFVRRVEWYDETTSTSDVAALRVVHPDAELPLLVVAERQTAGRGRGTHRWWSAPGALTFSLVYEPEPARLPAERWPQISLAIGLAVADFIAGAVDDVEVRLKWPNDVLLGRRKVCGILVESPAAAPARVVVGLGLNLNNEMSTAPPEVRGSAVSLAAIASRHFEPTDVLVGLLRGMETQLELLADSKASLVERWRPYCLLSGRTVEVRGHDGATRGLCQGIDGFGALLLITPEGTKRILSGTVTDFSPSV